MANVEQITVPAGTGEWATQHKRLYLRSGGEQGHIMDITAAGGLPFATHCLVRFAGRKSGRVMITGLCYATIGGEVVLCASKGGAPANPQWYENIVASDTVDFQIATQAFKATWREPAGAERDRLWALMVDCFPFYAAYQERTERIIPLLVLKAGAPIPVFSEADITDS